MPTWSATNLSNVLDILSVILSGWGKLWTLTGTLEFVVLAMGTQLSAEGRGKRATQFFQRYQGAKGVEPVVAPFIPDVQTSHVG